MLIVCAAKTQEVSITASRAGRHPTASKFDDQSVATACHRAMAVPRRHIPTLPPHHPRHCQCVPRLPIGDIPMTDSLPEPNSLVPGPPTFRDRLWLARQWLRRGFRWQAPPPKARLPAWEPAKYRLPIGPIFGGTPNAKSCSSCINWTRENEWTIAGWCGAPPRQGWYTTQRFLCADWVLDDRPMRPTDDLRLPKPIREPSRYSLKLED